MLFRSHLRTLGRSTSRNRMRPKPSPPSDFRTVSTPSCRFARRAVAQEKPVGGVGGKRIVVFELKRTTSLKLPPHCARIGRCTSAPSPRAINVSTDSCVLESAQEKAHRRWRLCRTQECARRRSSKAIVTLRSPFSMRLQPSPESPARNNTLPAESRTSSAQANSSVERCVGNSESRRGYVGVPAAQCRSSKF